MHAKTAVVIMNAAPVLHTTVLHLRLYQSKHIRDSPESKKERVLAEENTSWSGMGRGGFEDVAIAR